MSTTVCAWYAWYSWYYYHNNAYGSGLQTIPFYTEITEIWRILTDGEGERKIGKSDRGIEIRGKKKSKINGRVKGRLYSKYTRTLEQTHIHAHKLADTQTRACVCAPFHCLLQGHSAPSAQDTSHLAGPLPSEFSHHRKGKDDIFLRYTCSVCIYVFFFFLITEGPLSNGFYSGVYVSPPPVRASGVQYKIFYYYYNIIVLLCTYAYNNDNNSSHTHVSG